MCDVITWCHSVKRWSYSLGNDSIEILDLKNLENDTNKVAVRLLQPEIEYMTLWRHVWRHHVTSQCQALIVQSWKWFHWNSRPQKPIKYHQHIAVWLLQPCKQMGYTCTPCWAKSKDFLPWVFKGWIGYISFISLYQLHWLFSFISLLSTVIIHYIH